MASDDYGFPVKLGQEVRRRPGHWMWRIEVLEPDTMTDPSRSRVCKAGIALISIDLAQSSGGVPDDSYRHWSIAAFDVCLHQRARGRMRP